MRRPAILAAILASLAVLTTASSAGAMYHPTMGRWVARDPIGHVDGMDLYEYVMSAPTTYADWNGQYPIPPGTDIKGWGKPKGSQLPPDAQPQEQRQFGFVPQSNPPVAPYDALETLKDELGKVCPCFDYVISGSGDKRRLAVVPKKDMGDPDTQKPPTKAFCCCYYENLLACNLILEFRDKGMAKGYPQGQDVKVRVGAQWGKNKTVMGVKGPDEAQSGLRKFHTTFHEFAHGMTGVDADWAPDAVGNLLGTSDQPFTGTTGQPAAEHVRQVLGELVKDTYGCEKEASPDAKKRRSDFQDKARKIRELIN